jgi:hypothetical protein
MVIECEEKRKEKGRIKKSPHFQDNTFVWSLNILSQESNAATLTKDDL